MHFRFWEAMERSIHSLRCVHFHFVMSFFRVQLILKMHSCFWRTKEVYTPTLYCATIIHFESATLFLEITIFGGNNGLSSQQASCATINALKKRTFYEEENCGCFQT